MLTGEEFLHRHPQSEARDHKPTESVRHAPSPVERNTKRNVLLQPTRHNVVLTIAAACAAPIFYLIFLEQVSTNSLYDDWSVAPQFAAQDPRFID